MQVCISISITIHVSIHMNMIIGMRRSIHGNINISISTMHIRISFNICANISTNTGINVRIQQIINVSISIGNRIIITMVDAISGKYTSVPELHITPTLIPKATLDFVGRCRKRRNLTKHRGRRCSRYGLLPF